MHTHTQALIHANMYTRMHTHRAYKLKKKATVQAEMFSLYKLSDHIKNSLIIEIKTKYFHNIT